MSQIIRQPKQTDEIKALLAAFVKLQSRIDNKEKRIEALELTMTAPSIAGYDGAVGTGGRDTSSKMERNYIKLEELREQLENMIAEENRSREEIENMVDLMEKPNEQTVMEMRYLDGSNWWTICAALYGEEPDYDENEQRYLKRTFKLHGSALQSLARIHASITGATT